MTTETTATVTIDDVKVAETTHKDIAEKATETKTTPKATATKKAAETKAKPKATPKPTNLWRLLALRDDYPEGECWAWMESAERRCAKPADVRLCPRHVKVALAKLERLKAKRAPKVNPERRAMLERRIESYTLRLSAVELRLDALVNAGRPEQFDPAMVNLPLKGRVMTDAQLDRWRDLTERRDRYAWTIGLARAELRKLA